MTAARFQRVHVVVLLALVAASALGTFPHPHADKPRAGLETDTIPGTHAPRPGECLEHTHDAANTECAICFFQRVASHGQLADVPAAETNPPNRGIATPAQATFVADSVCLSDPRGPPTV